MVFEPDMAAEMRLVAIRETAPAVWARPHRAHRRAAYDLKRGEDRDHDRRAGRPDLGQVAPHLPRHRHPGLRRPAPPRPTHLVDGRTGARLHRVLDLPGAGGGVD